VNSSGPVLEYINQIREERMNREKNGNVPDSFFDISKIHGLGFEAFFKESRKKMRGVDWAMFVFFDFPGLLGIIMWIVLLIAILFSYLFGVWA
jgi:hypothetical protein